MQKHPLFLLPTLCIFYGLGTVQENLSCIMGGRIIPEGTIYTFGDLRSVPSRTSDLTPYNMSHADNLSD